MTVMAAVDLGAQSGRVAVGRFDGERLSVTEVHRFENVPLQDGSTLRWDVNSLYRDVVAGLDAAGNVDSIAVDSWAVDFALIGRDGGLLENPVHYRDPRRARAMARVLEEIPPRELYERTGIQLIPINTIFELAATGDAIASAETLLMIPDLMHYRLCGARTSERTNASTTQCWDPRAGAWALDLLERLGIPSRILPGVVEPATVIGSRGVAEVIAVGTHDTASAVAAVPFRQQGSAYISAGTWSLVGLELDRPLIDDASFAANLTNEAGVGGNTRLLKNVTGLWLLHECRRMWAEQGLRLSYDELVALAKDAPPHAATIDPDDPAFAEPGDMPGRIAERTGQHEPGAVVRCILESLALKHAQTVELLAEVTGTSPQEIHIVGGGARNELLCQWTADATGLPVLAGPEEATLVGNLLVQAIALGELSSLDDAREVVRRSFEPKVYEPQAVLTA